MDANFWNERYAADVYVYGQAPNGFLTETASQIPPGPVLCLAEGEGRNAVYLASRGYTVTAVDQSETGMAKARRLAETRNVDVTTVVQNLQDYRIAANSWNGVVAIFAHLPPLLRKRVFAEAVRGLRKGGVFILEAYTPAQTGYGTGGPKAPELLMSLGDLRQELAGLEFLIGREVEREIVEGTCHTGRGAVVQILARRNV